VNLARVPGILTAYRMLSPIIEPRAIWCGLRNYPSFVRDLFQYKKMMARHDRRASIELFPCLHERTSSTPFDSHYCYMGHWATVQLSRNADDESHVDVGSQISWVINLAATRRVQFVDIRPFDTHLENLSVQAGTVLDLPFPDQTVSSLSCLHVAEHVGLGRYGDPLDPLGTELAIRELARVLAPGGRLLFALPVGRQRICFNAHRIHAPQTIIKQFEEAGLHLESFSSVGDDHVYRENIDPETVAMADYACGMFVWTRSG
jgi:SAM-dependent methyltransferase